MKVPTNEGFNMCWFEFVQVIMMNVPISGSRKPLGHSRKKVQIISESVVSKATERN